MRSDSGETVAKPHRLVVCRLRTVGKSYRTTGQLRQVVRDTARKVLGVSAKQRKEDMETWWRGDDLQESIRKQSVAKKRWDMPTTRINMARCGENVTCRQTNDDSDTSVHDKYIAAAILERRE